MDAEIHVVGAGIGGVAAAIALARRGARVIVLEQAGTLEEVGAGLQISANGMAVLDGLAVLDAAVTDQAVESAGTDICDFFDGRRILSMPPPAAGPTWYFHRADLLSLLVDRAQAEGVTFHLGQRVDAFRVDEAGCVLELADGSTRQAGLVVAADGGQSRARLVVNGVSQPEFSRQVAWRATVPWNAGDDPARATLAMGPGKHVVTYPLRQGEMMNIVAVEERSDWTEEGWRLHGDPDEMRRRFAEFGGEAGQVLAKVTDTYLWALHLHPVASRWQRGSLALLGDAAHPTLPFMAQGACLALEDAWVLSECLAGEGLSGLRRYQDLRLPRARRVVAAAASNARKFHLRGPARWAAQLALGLFGDRLAPSYEWIYGFDVTASQDQNKAGSRPPTG